MSAPVAIRMCFILFLLWICVLFVRCESTHHVVEMHAKYGVSVSCSVDVHDIADGVEIIVTQDGHCAKAGKGEQADGRVVYYSQADGIAAFTSYKPIFIEK